MNPAINKIHNTQSDLLYVWFSGMHTRIDMLFSNINHIEVETFIEHIYQEIILLENIGNRFDLNSEISKVNLQAYQSPVIMSDDLYTMVQQCMYYYEETFGTFDITIQSENKYTDGIKNILLDVNKKSIFFENDQIKLDLSGYIKGYALEKIKSIINKYNCTDAFINMGNSSIMALGNHPAGLGWKIKLNDVSGTNDKEIILFDECLTSSGNTKIDRKHIINPQSRELIEGLKLVSIKTETGTLGEVLSTAFIAASDDQEKKLITKYGHLLV